MAAGALIMLLAVAGVVYFAVRERADPTATKQAQAPEKAVPEKGVPEKTAWAQAAAIPPVPPTITLTSAGRATS
jgi:hypothetical protein